MTTKPQSRHVFDNAEFTPTTLREEYDAAIKVSDARYDQMQVLTLQLNALLSECKRQHEQIQALREALTEIAGMEKESGWVPSLDDAVQTAKDALESGAI